MERSHSLSREDTPQRANEYPALNDNRLMQVLNGTNIPVAWKQVRRHQGAAGIDGMAIEQVPEWIRPQWRSLKEDVLKGSYRPQPVKRVYIPKDDGSERLLGSPVGLDRVIQQAMGQVLSP